MPSVRLFGSVLHLTRVDSCPFFAYFVIGIIRTMSEPVVASSWVRADDAFLHQSVSSRIGYHRIGRCILRMPLDVSLGAASKFEDCASTSNPSVNGFSSSKTVFLHVLMSLTVANG